MALAFAVIAIQPALLPDSFRPDSDGTAGPPEDSLDGSDGETLFPENPPPGGPFDATLLVRADTGPKGGEPDPVDARIRGTNLWFNSGWYPEVDPEWHALLDAMAPGVIRWPSGHPSQNYCFDPTNTRTPPPGCDAEHLVTGDQLEAFVALCRSLDAEPLIGVNVKRGTPGMAAEMVRYANVERDLDIKWWYIGNEPDLGGDMARLPKITRDFGAYSEAMRSVDPDVHLVGPEVMTGVNVLGIHGRADWIRPFLEGNPGAVDAISWHLYPLDSENRDERSSAHASVGNLVQWHTEDWRPSGMSFIAEAQAKLRADRDELMPGAEIWVTEVGPDSGMVGAPGVTDAQVAAVWFADVLGRFAEEDADALLQFAFDHWKKDIDELSLIRRHPDTNELEPLPPYYTFWAHARTWGDHTVNATSSDPANVAVHASVREDGGLAVVLVNKADEEKRTRLTLDAFGPVAHADVYRITADDPSSLEARVNGERLTSDNLNAIAPEEGPASTDAAWTLPPMSVTYVVFTPQDT